MKRIVIAGVLVMGLATMALAQDGASIYKSKCASCHGAEGQGKGKALPKVVGTAKTEDQIVAMLTKGGATKAPHVKPMAAMTDEQAKAVATFVKGLK
jgi:mono/diheme cytochrome c family protein